MTPTPPPPIRIHFPPGEAPYQGRKSPPRGITRVGVEAIQNSKRPLGPGAAGRLAAREFEELIRAPDRPIQQPRVQNRAFGMRPTYNTDAVNSRP
jgi:hypothetical protein